jgi:CHAT domain-containing protein/Tfp pilus assembly protein PilF
MESPGAKMRMRKLLLAAGCILLLTAFSSVPPPPDADVQAESAPENLTVAAGFNRLGNLAEHQGNLPQAESYHRKALEIRQKLAPESLLVAASLNNLGVLAWREGDVVKAEAYHRHALEIRQQRAPASLLVAASFHNLGLTAWTFGDLTKAEQYHREALEIRQKRAPGSLLVAASISNLGWVAWSQGAVATAEEYQREGLRIREQLAPESLPVAASLNNLGNLAAYQGDLAQAEEYHRRALEIRQKRAPASLLVAASISKLGFVALNQGAPEKAEEYYHRALEIRQRLAPGSVLVARSLYSLGLVARSRGDAAKAGECFLQALEIKKRLASESPGGRMGISNLGGDIATLRGSLAEAEEYYNEALASAETLAPGGLETATILQALGDLSRERGNLAKAERYYRRAIAGFAAIAPGSTRHAETLAALASVLRDRRQPRIAAHLYEQALHALETQAAHLGGSDDIRWGYRANHNIYYEDYIDLLIRQTQPEKAFSVLERSRARSLLELLATAHINVHHGVAPPLLSQERSLQADIAAKSSRRIASFNRPHGEQQAAALEKELASLLVRYQDVEARIRADSPTYAALTQPRTLSVREVQQQLLDQDTVLLEYSLGERRSYVFVVTAASLAVFALPGRVKIETTARSLYVLLTSRNSLGNGDAQAQYSQLATKLSQMVLGPVAPLIGHERLVIVGDGALQYIPFAALPIPSTHTGPTEPLMPQAQRPLVVEHEIVNLPSASVLAELRRQARNRPEPRQAVAVLADPVFDSKDRRVIDGVNTAKMPRPSLQAAALAADKLTRSASEMASGASGQLNLDRIEYTRQEANSILATAPRGSTLEALDFQASRTLAMSPALADYRVIHFATHGILNSRHPELSGLVFSLVDQHGEPQNGFLDLEDIYGLSLPVDLVALSGCETGLGKEIRGEGLIGLTRGFMYAGSTRVLASLWNVSDEATAELMAAFYRSIEQEKQRPAAALRAAQLEIRQQDVWKSPYYWAGFEIQGEWR